MIPIRKQHRIEKTISENFPNYVRFDVVESDKFYCRIVNAEHSITQYRNTPTEVIFLWIDKDTLSAFTRVKLLNYWSDYITDDPLENDLTEIAPKQLIIDPMKEK